jgi:hypothetical protein
MSIEAYPSPNGVLTSLIWRKTAAGSETSLSGYDNNNQALSYTPGQEQVYLNGILLVRGEDYTATNGTSITNLSALAADDYVQINCYNNFSVASVPSTSINGEIPVGNIPSTIARVAGPTFTGVPAAPTASAGTNTTQIATTAFVTTAVSNLVDTAPSTLDTLNELAAALGDDANYASTVTTALGLKAPLSGPTFTGNVVLPTTTISPYNISTPTISANTYTIASGDESKILLISNGSTASTVYIPTDATWNAPVGTNITIVQVGSGQVTVQATTSGTTTVNSTGASATAPKTRTTSASAILVKTSSNVWYVFGDVS